MKTNIPLLLTDKQRLNLGQKYYDTKGKKLISRKDLNKIVNDYIKSILSAKPLNEISINNPLLKKKWGSLEHLIKHFEKTDTEQVISYNGFSVTTDKYIYTLAFEQLHRRKTHGG
tara:strand:+ start:33 stop:377 length:345 start_codon:yes stop_codon:yes gene_type:complete